MPTWGFLHWITIFVNTLFGILFGASERIVRCDDVAVIVSMVFLPAVEYLCAPDEVRIVFNVVFPRYRVGRSGG